MTEAGRRGDHLGWRKSDPRLPSYLLAGFGGLVAAVVTGQGELAALGTPFLVLAFLGLTRGAPRVLAAGLTLESDRAIEGGELAGEVRVDWDGEAGGRGSDCGLGAGSRPLNQNRYWAGRCRWDGVLWCYLSGSKAGPGAYMISGHSG